MPGRAHHNQGSKRVQPVSAADTLCVVCAIADPMPGAGVDASVLGHNVVMLRETQLMQECQAFREGWGSVWVCGCTKLPHPHQGLRWLPGFFAQTCQCPLPSMLCVTPADGLALACCCRRLCWRYCCCSSGDRLCSTHSAPAGPTQQLSMSGIPHHVNICLRPSAVGFARLSVGGQPVGMPPPSSVPVQKISCL